MLRYSQFLMIRTFYLPSTILCFSLNHNTNGQSLCSLGRDVLTRISLQWYEKKKFCLLRSIPVNLNQKKKNFTVSLNPGKPWNNQEPCDHLSLFNFIYNVYKREGSQARSTASGSGPDLAGVLGFESHPSHYYGFFGSLLAGRFHPS